MSHTRRKTVKTGSSIRILYIGTLFLCLFAFFDVMMGTAHAATSIDTKTHKRPSYILKSSLANLSHTDKAELDWRSHSFVLSFDLPAHDWYESLDLFLSAYPEGSVSRSTPLMISFNGAPAIPLHGKGTQFDAQIHLATNKIRSSHNSVVISYKTPAGEDCLNASHGKWVLNLSRSKLVARARSKHRNMQIIEIEQRLSHPMTAPKRVAILAKGTNKFALEALSAQGIAQRVDTLPSFQFASAASDLTVIIGTRDKIRPLVNNKDMLDVKSMNVFVDTGARTKLVLTAQTEAHVLEVARAFARFHLPAVRRTNTTLQALYMSPQLSPRPALTTNTYRLSDIGDTILMPSWRPAATHVDFNVKDAHSSSGSLVLNIITGPDTDPASRMNVSLNGQSIGYTHLNKTKKNVSFDIRAGMLKPVGNVLSMQPDFSDNTAQSACPSRQTPPRVLISGRSKLSILNPVPTPATDLSRFAASGAPFNGNTALVLTARSTKDRASTLRFLGFAAQKFGPQWAMADYKTAMPAPHKRDTNILIIGPHIQSDSQLIASAPRALKLALRGKPFKGPATATLASVEHYASLDANNTFKTRAGQTHSRIGSGGIAALFPSPYASNRIVGVISATNPAQFSRAMKATSQDKFWNAFQGGVMRWDKNTVLMAQTAIPLPASFSTSKQKPSFLTWVSGSKAKMQSWVSGLKPTKPVSTRENIPVKRSVVQLRGAVKLPVKTTPVMPDVTPASYSHSSASVLATVKASATHHFTALQSSVKRMKLPTFPNTAPDFMRGMESKLGSLNNNRAIWLILIAFAAFILIGRASPKAR